MSDPTGSHWREQPKITRLEAMNKAIFHAEAGHVLMETLPDQLDPLFGISQAQVHATLAQAYVEIASNGVFMKEGRRLFMDMNTPPPNPTPKPPPPKPSIGKQEP